jgi:hypothetical protein
MREDIPFVIKTRIVKKINTVPIPKTIKVRAWLNKLRSDIEFPIS